MKKIYLVSFLISCLFVTSTYSQGLYQVSADEKFANSSLIVEGKVIAQKCFWNPEHSMIFTANKVEVYKVFKGSISQTTIDVITQGGSIGTVSIEASDLLSLQNDELGVFFCFPNKGNLRSPMSNEILFDVYSSAQGFFSYDLMEGTASAPFVRYGNIVGDLYKELTTKIGRDFENKKPSFSVSLNPPRRSSPLAPVITSFTPATVNAGATIDVANNLLIISGSGFGLPGGSAAVLFDDANNGSGGTAFTVVSTDNTVVSWTDTEIRIRVPSRAGTGTFTVRDAAGLTVNSPTPLTVQYAVLTATFTDPGPPVTITKESNLMNDNGTGGYTLVYSDNTAGSGINFNTAPEKATFQRALTTWKEVSGLNFVEGGTTTVQTVTGDGNNLVVFDNTNAGVGVTPIPAGTLAVCYSFNSMCLPITTNSVQKTEFDIIVRNPAVSTGATTFTVGPCPPMASNFSEIDLETVLLHELGHALNLAHINDSYEGSFAGELNPGKLMNFAVVNSVKRVSPDFSAKVGATYTIANQANTYGSCGLSSVEMTVLTPTIESKDECPLTFPTASIPLNTAVNFDLVHATSNKFRDPSYTQADCSAITGVGITNTAYYAFRTNSAGGVVSLSVTGYTTTPAAPATCPTPFGFPTKGVELLLYQVSTCPSGQAFPAPIACRSFDGNGALANFTGLAANTNYLIMVDGIENTKANFNLVFTGSALPINLSDFTGVVLDKFNQLSWTIEFAKDVKALYLQRSADGIVFENVAEVTSSISSRKGVYADKRPLAGLNYYRLVTINLDDTKDYSKIIQLKRKDNLLVNVFPNPASQLLNIEINSVQKEKFSIVLHNSLGQRVKSEELTVSSGRELISLNVSQLAHGLYNVVIYNQKKEVVKSERITIQ